MIDGCCKNVNMNEALRVKDDMFWRGIEHNAATIDTVLQDLCQSNEMEFFNLLVMQPNGAKIWGSMIVSIFQRLFHKKSFLIKNCF